MGPAPLSFIRRIRRIRDRRKVGDSLLIEGPRYLQAALEAGVQVEGVLLAEAWEPPPSLEPLLSQAGVPRYGVAASVLAELAETQTPQGVLAVAAFREQSLADLPLDNDPLLLVLAGVGDPGNVGTLIRSAHAAGARAVLRTPGTAGIHSGKVVRSSAGSLFALPQVLLGESWAEFLRQRGIRLIGADAHAPRLAYEMDLRGPLALILGNEAHGLPADLPLERVRLPMPGGAESLNVAVAGSILLYEAVRQRLGDA